MHSGELWQEYTPNGEPIAGVGHPKDYYIAPTSTAICGVAQVWLYRDTPTGRELLFQLRSPRVHNGNTWSISAAGHIDLGETSPEAALREAQEKPSPIHTVYLYNFTDQPDNFHFDDGEVSDMKWVSLSDLDDFLRSGNVTPSLASIDYYWQILRLHLDHHEN